jgi:hypothetical protein
MSEAIVPELILKWVSSSALVTGSIAGAEYSWTFMVYPLPRPVATAFWVTVQPVTLLSLENSPSRKSPTTLIAFPTSAGIPKYWQITPAADKTPLAVVFQFFTVPPLLLVLRLEGMNQIRIA